MMALECACGRKMYPDAALLRCPGCGRPTATMGPCSMTSKPEGREVEARKGGTLRGDGSGAITIKAEAGAVHVDRPHVATLPDGSRVELPAGTVLREAPTPEHTPQENFAALKLMAPSLAGVYERAGVKLGIEPHLVTEEQAYEECPALRLADPLPIKPRT